MRLLVGHVRLDDMQAKQLSRTKALVVTITCVMSVWMVINRSMPAAMFSGWFAAFFFRMCVLLTQYNTMQPKILGLCTHLLCLLVRQHLLWFVLINICRQRSLASELRLLVFCSCGQGLLYAARLYCVLLLSFFPCV